MSKMYFGSIDLNKIDKTKIVSVSAKTGKPFDNGALYLNVVVWVNDEVDQYGNIASIQIGQTQEEREAKVKATYIGNLKNPQGQDSNKPSKAMEPTNQPNGVDDLPF